jgi:hypothetical protein
MVQKLSLKRIVCLPTGLKGANNRVEIGTMGFPQIFGTGGTTVVVKRKMEERILELERGNFLPEKRLNNGRVWGNQEGPSPEKLTNKTNDG